MGGTVGGISPAKKTGHTHRNTVSRKTAKPEDEVEISKKQQKGD